MKTQTLEQHIRQIGKPVKWWSSPFNGTGILREIHYDTPLYPYLVEDYRDGKPCGSWWAERIEPLEDEQPLRQGITRDTWEQMFDERFALIASGYVGIRHGRTTEYRKCDNAGEAVKAFIHELLKSIDAERGHNED